MDRRLEVHHEPRHGVNISIRNKTSLSNLHASYTFLFIKEGSVDSVDHQKSHYYNCNLLQSLLLVFGHIFVKLSEMATFHWLQCQQKVFMLLSILLFLHLSKGILTRKNL